MTGLDNAAISRLKAAADIPALTGDRYVDLHPIGRGSMGAVFAARDTWLGRDVAIKVSHLTMPNDDDSIGGESRVLARLEHPGIVPIHDAGVTSDGRTYYAMKMVRGQSLKQFLAVERELSARLSLFERIVDAVGFAHANGVIHRDLSPANIMVGGFGEALVLDWGVARAMSATEPDTLRVGTPGFAAPELAHGLASPASDVYSLGAILDLSLGDLAPQAIPKRLRAIAAKCAGTDAGTRYRDASALGADLAALRAGRPVTAYRETWIDSASKWFDRYGAFAALVIAYLVMRVVFAFLDRRS